MHLCTIMEISPKLVWRFHKELTGGLSDIFFFIYCTEVNSYPVMKYIYLRLMIFYVFFNYFWRRCLFDNSYMNEKTCESPSKTIKIKISHIFETASIPMLLTTMGNKRVCT